MRSLAIGLVLILAAALVPLPVAADAIVAADDFGRIETGAWGSADSGGAWTLGGAASSFGVGSGVGSMSIRSAGATRTATLGTVSVADASIVVRLRSGKAAVGGSQYGYVAGRRQSGNEYRIKVRFAPSGAVFAGATRYVGGAEADVGGEVRVTGVTHAANWFFGIRAELTGTSPTGLRMRVWDASQSEPSTWTLNVTDAMAQLQGPGPSASAPTWARR